MQWTHKAVHILNHLPQILNCFCRCCHCVLERRKWYVARPQTLPIHTTECKEAHFLSSHHHYLMMLYVESQPSNVSSLQQVHNSFTAAAITITEVVVGQGHQMNAYITQIPVGGEKYHCSKKKGIYYMYCRTGKFALWFLRSRLKMKFNRHVNMYYIYTAGFIHAQSYALCMNITQGVNSGRQADRV